MNVRSRPKRRRQPTGPKAIPLLAVLLLAGTPALAEGGTSVGVSTGLYGLRAGLPHELAIQVELRPPWQWGPLRPVAGTLADSSGGAYLFTGFVFEIPLPGGLQLSPGFAPGAVLSQGHRDLGSPIEFRSSIELSGQLVPPARFIVSFSHISNGGLTQHNPGAETLMFGFDLARH
jgi:lipid A 3-O-deacylase